MADRAWIGGGGAARMDGFLLRVSPRVWRDLAIAGIAFIEG